VRIVVDSRRGPTEQVFDRAAAVEGAFKDIDSVDVPAARPVTQDTEEIVKGSAHILRLAHMTGH
jgi:hypothetical protein